MRAIVHIGMPKTGTTAIQTWLAANADGLLRQGALYDRVALPGVRQYVAHVELQLAQLTALGEVTRSRQSRATYGIATLDDQRAVVDRFAEGLAAARDRAEGADRMLLSSEQIGATTDSPAAARALHDWLGGFFDRIDYVMYIRRQEDWLASNYPQTLRRGATHGFGAYVAGRRKINYMRVARHFLAAAGDDAVTIRLCEPDDLAGGDVVTDFAGVCAIDPTPLGRPPRSNAALSAAACEVLRRLNAILGPRGSAPDGKLLSRAKSALNGLDDRSPPLVLPEAERAAVRKVNARSNARLCSRFFPDRAELFPARAASPGVAQAAPDDIARVAEALHAKLGRALRPHLEALVPGEVAR